MQLTLFDKPGEYEPGKCPHEGPTFDTMVGPKTECRLLDAYTTCVAEGRCKAGEEEL